MDYERFKEGFQDALKAELAVRGADVELTARRVDKMNVWYVATDVGHFLWSQLVQLRIWFARNAVPALLCA